MRCEHCGVFVGFPDGRVYVDWIFGVSCIPCATPAELDYAGRALAQSMASAATSITDECRALGDALLNAARDRDARELRGERIDWTRPVEGWVLW